MRKMNLLTSLFVISAMAAAGIANAGIFVEIAGVPGKSTVRGYESFTNIESFGTSVSQTSSGENIGSARTRARGEFADLTITKKVDDNSPLLAVKTATGEVIPTVKIIVTKRGDRDTDEKTFYEIQLENVMITSYSVTGHAESGEAPAEELSFSYEKIKWTVTPFDERGGAIKPKTASFDIARGTADTTQAGGGSTTPSNATQPPRKK